MFNTFPVAYVLCAVHSPHIVFNTYPAPCFLFFNTLHSPDEEAPQGPGEDEEDAQEPALRDEERDGQHDGVGVVLDHDEELCHRDGGHQPRLLA